MRWTPDAVAHVLAARRNIIVTQSTAVTTSADVV